MEVSMHSIAICEDNPEDSALLQNLLDDYELAMNEPLYVKCFADAESMLARFSENDYRPEILFMDISLPGLSGIEAVRTLRDADFSGEIIFTTSSPDYALNAFELNARQYFTKPLSKQKVFQALEQLLSSRRDYMFIKSGRSLRKVRRSEILYCETQGKYQIIHTHSEEIKFRSSSRNMKSLCPPPVSNFAALGSAYLINIENIHELSECRVIFDGGQSLMLSRGRFLKLRRLVMNFSAHQYI